MKRGKYTKTLAKIQARGVFVYEISEEMFTQIYKGLYGDAMLVPTWMGTNMADGTKKNLLPGFGTKAKSCMKISFQLP